MQVLCKPCESSADLQCPICGRGFQLYWERTSREQQLDALREIQQTLRDHHTCPAGTHPDSAFTIPPWSGQPQFSAAALLGGAF